MAIGYLYGDSQPMNLPILSSQVVAVGDVCCISSGNLIRASDITWQTAVATPAAPTVTNSNVAQGTNLTNNATGVKISYQFPWGEGTLSPAGSGTPTAAATLVVSGTPLTPPSPALYTNVYVETSAGSGVYKLYGITYGSQVVVAAYGNGQVPYAANLGAVAVSSGALQVTQYQCALTFLGFSGQYKGLTNYLGQTQTIPYGNSAAVVRIMTQGLLLGDLSAATTVTVGQYVAPAQDVGNNLQNQTLVVGVPKGLAIGQIIQAGTSLTRVQFCQLVNGAYLNQPSGA